MAQPIVLRDSASTLTAAGEAVWNFSKSPCFVFSASAQLRVLAGTSRRLPSCVQLIRFRQLHPLPLFGTAELTSFARVLLWIEGSLIRTDAHE